MLTEGKKIRAQAAASAELDNNQNAADRSR